MSIPTFNKRYAQSIALVADRVKSSTISVFTLNALTGPLNGIVLAGIKTIRNTKPLVGVPEGSLIDYVDCAIDKAVKRPDQIHVLFVVNLDEVSGLGQHVADLRLLAHQVHQFPKNFKLVVTVRTSPQAFDDVVVLNSNH